MYVGTERVTPSFLCARLSLSESPVSGPVSLPDSGSDLVSEHMMTHDHMGGPIYNSTDLALSPFDSDSADRSPRGSQCCWPLPRLTSVPRLSPASWSRAPGVPPSAPRLFSFLRRLDRRP